MVVLKRLFGWIKQRTFHFITSIILILGAIIILGQQVLIASLENKINESVNNINAQSIEYHNNIIANVNSFKKASDYANSQLLQELEIVKETLNARVDMIDNTIRVDEKRREQIVKIRDAITENTSEIIGVRDLNRMANAIIDYSYQYNFTIPQILAQIKVESNFKQRAESKAGALGLMQIMPDTMKYIQYTMSDAPPKLNTYNIYHNIKAGCFYLSEQLEEFGTYTLALQAYNWGPRSLRKHNAGEIANMPEETKQYTVRIDKYIKVFETYGL